MAQELAQGDLARVGQTLWPLGIDTLEVAGGRGVQVELAGVNQMVRHGRHVRLAHAAREHTVRRGQGPAVFQRVDPGHQGELTAAGSSSAADTPGTPRSSKASSKACPRSSMRARTPGSRRSCTARAGASRVLLAPDGTATRVLLAPDSTATAGKNNTHRARDSRTNGLGSENRGLGYRTPCWIPLAATVQTPARSGCVNAPRTPAARPSSGASSTDVSRTWRPNALERHTNRLSQIPPARLHGLP